MTIEERQETQALVRLEDYKTILGRDKETSLRPQTLDQYIGQEELKRELRIEVEAAKMGEPLNHMLFSGPAGIGKTSLAKLMANELGVNMTEAKGEDLKDPNDLMAIVKPMLDGDILFVDEVHQLNHRAQEALYTAMEDYEVTITLGGGPTAKVMKTKLPKFIMIGATTETGKLLTPLLARFGFRGELRLYSEEDLKKIVVRSAKAKGITIDERAAELIAQRSHGTPRDANGYLDRIKRYSLVIGEGRDISTALTESYFEMVAIDPKGLTRRQRGYLEVLCRQFQGGPVGVINLASYLKESTNSVTEMESGLISTGMILKCNNGRTATRDAYIHLGMRLPDQPEGMELIEELERRYRES